ncbi:Uncharacterised protein [uncultured archaeon]|nr:Uncharacterised protein [uncultured archaeon]
MTERARECTVAVDYDGVYANTIKCTTRSMMPAALRGGSVERVATNVLFPICENLKILKRGVESRTQAGSAGPVEINEPVRDLMTNYLNCGVEVIVLTSNSRPDFIRRVLDEEGMPDVDVRRTDRKAAYVRKYCDENPDRYMVLVDDSPSEALRFVREFGIRPNNFIMFSNWHNEAVAFALAPVVRTAKARTLDAEIKQAACFAQEPCRVADGFVADVAIAR